VVVVLLMVALEVMVVVIVAVAVTLAVVAKVELQQKEGKLQSVQLQLVILFPNSQEEIMGLVLLSMIKKLGKHFARNTRSSRSTQEKLRKSRKIDFPAVGASVVVASHAQHRVGSTSFVETSCKRRHW
jgi:hypothetical protein